MFKKNLKYIGVIAGLILIGLTILAGSYFRVLEGYELSTLDKRFQLRPKIAVTDDIVIIEISDDTIEQIGQFPIDRNNHSALVQALTQAGAKAVIFDIFFSEPHENDEEFELAINLAGNVYFPHVYELSDKRNKVLEATDFAAKNLDYLSLPARGTGHINIVPDIDGKFRRVPLFLKHNEKYEPYLSFLAALKHLKLTPEEVTFIPGKHILYDTNQKIPLDDHSNVMINFTGRWGESYKHYSYVDVVRSYIAQFSGEPQILNLNVFKDKVCLIGLTAEGTTDLHPNPFETLYPAVGIHAEIFNSIVNHNFIRRASKEVNVSILIGLIILIMFISFRIKPIKALIILLVCAGAFLIISWLLFVIFGLWIDVFYPIVVAVFTYIVCTLWKYIVEWKSRILLENELQIARKIQESFLPKSLPKTGNCDIAATMLTARQVGGDLYDFLEFNEDQLGIMIGDVTGKGVPASLFMAMVVAGFKFFAKEEVLPEKSLAQLNTKLIQESTSNLFVTMFYAIFNVKTREVIFGSGGHNPTVYVPTQGSAQFLDVEDGLPIGMMEGAYTGNKMHYKKNDVFVFYTDGVTEATNKRKEMYGAERLAALIEKNRHLSAENILRTIEKDVRIFEPIHRQSDDITFIVIKFPS